MDAPLDRLERTLVAERPRLVGVAYRITGSRVEAEDIVQEAWLRARRADAAGIENPEAWLTTVVSRLALDSLKSARVRRESYVGPYLPEPVPTAGPGAGAGGGVGTAVGAATGGGGDGDPAGMAERSESLTFGFLRVLDTLTPVERVVFLLADVFDVPYAQIAEVVGRTPEACRQVASRARRRVRAERPADASAAPAAEAQAVASDLVAAFAAADVDRLVALLGDDCVLISDGGPHVRAARRPVVGPERVSRFLAWLSRRYAEEPIEVETRVLNGEPGLVVRHGGAPLVTMSFAVAAGRVTAIHIVRNPEKLLSLDLDPVR